MQEILDQHTVIQLCVEYTSVLKYGLTSVRDALIRNDIEYCTLEAEHLHNLPALLASQCRESHDYYCLNQRVVYLKWIVSSGKHIHLEFVADWYVRRWRQIDAILEINKFSTIYEHILQKANNFNV